MFQWRKEWTAPAAVGAVSFGAGVGVGYGIRSYLNYRLVKDLRNEIKAIEEDVHQLKLVDPIELIDPIDPNQLVIPSWETPKITETYDYSEDEVDSQELVSVFPEDEGDEWDWNEETQNRNPGTPYVIHKDEFDENENDWPCTTLTYYEGDEILCDEADVPIYNAHQVVGELKFGHGSKDPNVVYIRNEKLQAQYEVLKDSGDYAVEVLGQEYEDSFDNTKISLQKFREE